MNACSVTQEHRIGSVFSVSFLYQYIKKIDLDLNHEKPSIVTFNLYDKIGFRKPYSNTGQSLQVILCNLSLKVR